MVRGLTVAQAGAGGVHCGECRAWAPLQPAPRGFWKAGSPAMAPKRCGKVCVAPEMKECSSSHAAHDTQRAAALVWAALWGSGDTEPWTQASCGRRREGTLRSPASPRSEHGCFEKTLDLGLHLAPTLFTSVGVSRTGSHSDSAPGLSVLSPGGQGRSSPLPPATGGAAPPTPGWGSTPSPRAGAAPEVEQTPRAGRPGRCSGRLQEPLYHGTQNVRRALQLFRPLWTALCPPADPHDDD